MTDMELFDSSNWHLTKFLLSSVGAWPFQSSTKRTILQIIMLFMIFSILLPQIFRIITMWHDLDIVIETLTGVFLHLATLINTIYGFLNTKMEKRLLLKIKAAWESRSQKHEMKYLQIYAHSNSLITRSYMFSVCGAVILVIITSFLPKILDYFLPLKNPRPVIFIYQVEYFIDPVKNDIFILSHNAIVVIFEVTIIVAFDCLYTTFAQHACSMFFIMSRRMEYLSQELDRELEKNHQFYKAELVDSFTNCIQEHVKVLEFAHDVQSIYSNALFLLLGVNMLAISVTGCHTVAKLNEPNPPEAMKFGAYMACQLAHLYFLSWPGQNLMDHSSHLFHAIYQGEWYNIPLKMRKLLIIIMMRSCRPCTLSAGKLHVMSMENFAMIVRTSVSYFTVLSSRQ